MTTTLSKRANLAVMLFYSASKVGKTHLIGTYGPKQLYVFFEEADGTETLKNARFGALADEMPVIMVPKADDTYDATMELIDKAIDEERHRFDAITIDEMTAFRKGSMRKAILLNKEEKRSQSADKSGRRKGVIIPTIADYGTEMNLTEHFIAESITITKNEGLHFFCCAHERHIFGTGDKKDVLLKIRPSFTGRTAPDDIVTYFDFVGHLERVNETVRMQTKGNSQMCIGNRFDSLFPEFIINPDLAKMVRAIEQRGEV